MSDAPRTDSAGGTVPYTPPGLFSTAEDVHFLRENWLTFLTLGIVLTAVGLIALGSLPFASLATAVMFGILTLVAGVALLASAVFSRRRGNFLLDLLLGVFYVILGVLMLRYPGKLLEVVTLLLGVFILSGGILRIAAAFSFRFHRWGWTVFSGVLAVILGGIILLGWPWTSVWVVGMFIGFEFLFNGLNWIMVALFVRRIPDSSGGTSPSEDVLAPAESG